MIGIGKVFIIENQNEKLVCVHCPGCRFHHPFRVRGAGPNWQWNGETISPAFSPSMLVNSHHPESRCHSFVEGGNIRFLGDCHHDLKNQTVELPLLNEDGDPIEGGVR